MSGAQQNVLNAQELAGIQFSQDIQSDPAQYQAYVKQNVQKLMDETLGRKRSAFQKSYVDTGRYMDMDHNAQLYQTRSSDVDKIQSVIRDANTKVESGIDMDKKNSRRQFEINEWAHQNKLETLFFLQLLFITVLVLAVFLFLAKNGILPRMIAGSLIAIVFLGVAYTGYYRWSYTNNTRDPRQWSRRIFPEEDKSSDSNLGRCDAQGNFVIDVKNLVPEILSDNIDGIEQTFQKVSSEIQDQALSYQTNSPINRCPSPPVSM